MKEVSASVGTSFVVRLEIHPDQNNSQNNSQNNNLNHSQNN